MPIEEITGISTQEFWARYAKKGAVGLVGGTLWIHRAICEALALVTPDHKPSLWAHAFIFTGKRADGFDWLAESDLVVEPLRLRKTEGENFTLRREGMWSICRAIKMISPRFGKGKASTCLTSQIRKFILPQLNSGVSANPAACCGVSERIRLCFNLKNRDSLRMPMRTFTYL
jgi:hypothetical protein